MTPPVTPPGDGSLRRIPDSGFAGDDGAAPPALADALAAYAADRRTGLPQVLGVLGESRLLVPVVAVLGEVEHDESGLAHEKSSDMAAVLMRAADGSTGLLAFTATASLTAWDPGARPVPVTGRVAAQSAIQDGASALVLDVAGPVLCAIEGEDLRALAAGWRLVGLEGRDGGWGWLAPDRP